MSCLKNLSNLVITKSKNFIDSIQLQIFCGFFYKISLLCKRTVGLLFLGRHSWADVLTLFAEHFAHISIQIHFTEEKNDLSLKWLWRLKLPIFYHAYLCFQRIWKKILLRTYLDLKIDGIFLSNWDKWKYLNSDLDWVVISAIKIENSNQYFMACNVE